MPREMPIRGPYFANTGSDTVWRGWHAAQAFSQREGAWRTQYVSDVGLTLIALFDGFMIVSVLELGAPPWIVIAVGVLASCSVELRCNAYRAALRRRRPRERGTRCRR